MSAPTMPMLDTYPLEINLDRRLLGATIDALIACGNACTACADACLGEESVAELTTCVRSNLDCADICATTARVLTRHTGYDATTSRALLEACLMACRSCREECASHADTHEHCRICADSCQSAESACRELLQSMG